MIHLSIDSRNTFSRLVRETPDGKEATLSNLFHMFEYKKPQEIYDSFVQVFHDSRVQAENLCPTPGAVSGWFMYGKYKRYFEYEIGGLRYSDCLEIQRYACYVNSPDDAGKTVLVTHALLPFFIIPYSVYSPTVIIKTLIDYYRGMSYEMICGHYHISESTLCNWIHKFEKDYAILFTALAALTDVESAWEDKMKRNPHKHPNYLEGINHLCNGFLYVEILSMYCKTEVTSFMQSHKNPMNTPRLVI